MKKNLIGSFYRPMITRDTLVLLLLVRSSSSSHRGMGLAICGGSGGDRYRYVHEEEVTSSWYSVRNPPGGSVRH